MSNGSLCLNKMVPAERVPLYTNNGWVLGATVGRNQSKQFMTRTLVTGTGRDQRESIEFRHPYLIQIGKIRRPMGKFHNATLTEAVELEYMGAAEFEWGALPLSLRRVQAQLSLYHIIKCEELFATSAEGKTFVMRMFANFDTEEQERQYRDWILEIVNGTRYTKEWTCLQRSERPNGTGLPKRGTDFWWDIRNDIFMSFDKLFMSRLPKTVAHTITRLESAGRL